MMYISVDLAIQLGAAGAIIVILYNRIARIENKILTCIIPKINSIEVKIAKIETEVKYIKELTLNGKTKDKES